jgi:hypothetical protein
MHPCMAIIHINHCICRYIVRLLWCMATDLKSTEVICNCTSGNVCDWRGNTRNVVLKYKSITQNVCTSYAVWTTCGVPNALTTCYYYEPTHELRMDGRNYGVFTFVMIMICIVVAISVCGSIVCCAGECDKCCCSRPDEQTSTDLQTVLIDRNAY